MKRWIIPLLMLMTLACSLTTGTMGKSAPGLASPTLSATAIPTSTPKAATPTQAKAGKTLLPTSASYSPTPTLTPMTCTVLAAVPDGWLNLRECAGVDCRIQAVLSRGQTVTILPTPAPLPTAGAGWFAVDAGDGLTGWINSSYCEVTK